MAIVLEDGVRDKSGQRSVHLSLLRVYMMKQERYDMCSLRPNTANTRFPTYGCKALVLPGTQKRDKFRFMILVLCSGDGWIEVIHGFDCALHVTTSKYTRIA